MFDEFPKWMYHREEPARIVETPDEQDALGAEWAETPAAFFAETPAAEPAEQTEKKKRRK